MLNAKKSPAMVCAPAKPCASTTAPVLSDGATTTPRGSNTPCCTPASSETQTGCGASPSDTSPADAEPAHPQTLLGHVTDPQYLDRVASIAMQVPAANDQQTVHGLFREGVTALGASCAVFVSFVRDDQHMAACRFMLACDPAWGRTYVQDGHFAHDPWLAYAAHHTEPLVASQLKVLDGQHQRVIDLATRAGFVSTVLVPAHSAPGHSRISLLCLGSAHPGYFEGQGQAQLRLGARMLTLELHEWWLARIRRDLIVKARISQDDLVLLQHRCQGHSSKKIAADLQVTKGSVNSRFQRMNAKLGVGNRRMAVQLAIECGLILK
jgi:DNA-binding CsgD family transcriptional regulator